MIGRYRWENSERSAWRPAAAPRIKVQQVSWPRLDVMAGWIVGNPALFGKPTGRREPAALPRDSETPFTLYHAYLVRDAQGRWYMASNAVLIVLKNQALIRAAGHVLADSRTKTPARENLAVARHRQH